MTPRLPAHRVLYTIYTGWHWHAICTCGHKTQHAQTADQARQQLTQHTQDNT